MLQDTVIVSLVTFIGGGGLTLAGKALLWDRMKKNGVPHAKNGFLSFGEIQAHCRETQENCQKVISSDIKAQFAAVNSSITLMGSNISGRLDQNDRQLEELKKTIEDLHK